MVPAPLPNPGKELALGSPPHRGGNGGSEGWSVLLQTAPFWLSW